MLQYLLLCLLRGKTNRVIDPWTLAIFFHAAEALHAKKTWKKTATSPREQILTESTSRMGMTGRV